MKKTAEDLLMDMEDRRRETADQLNKELAQWTDKLEKAANDALAAAGDPDKADAYKEAEENADIARHKISQINCQIMHLQQRKIPLATPAETKEFYECLYSESLQKLREIADAFGSYYQVLRELTKEAGEVRSKTLQLSQKWNNEISLMNSAALNINSSIVQQKQTCSSPGKASKDKNPVFEFQNIINVIDEILKDLSKL